MNSCRITGVVLSLFTLGLFFVFFLSILRPEVDYEAFTKRGHPGPVRLAAVQSMIQLYLAYDIGQSLRTLMTLLL